MTRIYQSSALLVLFVAMLSGCATVRGSQDAVDGLTPRTLVPVETALKNYYLPADSSRLGMSQRNYREYIVSIYLSSIESKYKSFTDQLQSSDRGSALGLDLIMLGLNGATALVGMSAVDELATVTAVGSGVRSTIDKRLFFDRTLPAVIASMDAERASIKADIASKRDLTAQQYGLNDAIDDLHRLQQAGRLDRAVSRITQAAENDRAAQEARLNSIVADCGESTEETGRITQRFRKIMLLDDAAKSSARLAIAARVVGYEPADGETLRFGSLAGVYNQKYCTDAAKTEFVDGLEATILQEEN